jgi:hypothetical protein
MRQISLWGTLQKRVCVWGMTLLLSGGLALAQDEQARQPFWGTSDAPATDTSAFETEVAAPVAAHATYTTAQYASGGVGLRNRGTGGISISGAITPIKAAFLYWAVITSDAAKTPDTQMKLQRLSPTPASAVTTLTGTLIGTGPSPCWIGNTISVFRATVPTTLATGNGLYQVTLLPGAGGSTAGGDPWVGTRVLPLFEGASLVIVGTGPSGSRVVIYDSGIAGKTFDGAGGLSYSLSLPAAATGKLTLFDSIGADGQEGDSRLAESGLGDESTYINGVYVAGPFSLSNDSDWNGSSGKPIPQLWDDIGHNITTSTPSGTKTLDIAIGNGGEAPSDCMTPVANVVQEE